MNIRQLLRAPAGMHAIFKYPDLGYRLIPAACLALLKGGGVVCLAIDRWGEVIDPTEEEFFVGWTYKSETLESADVQEFLAVQQRLQDDDHDPNERNI